MSHSIEPFTLAIPERDLVDLHRRLDAARWPEPETVDDWSQGVPTSSLAALIDHWRHAYDWRRCESQLNALGQFRTEIDGVVIHFLHIRSRIPDALPLILTHGWPGSIIEFLQVAAPLTDPQAHGGNAADAFHLVIPCLPGFGFSGKPTGPGWGIQRIAAAWEVLMTRLGYDRFVAQGGDWGAAITTALGVRQHPALAAIHLNFPMVTPPSPLDSPTPEESAMLDALAHYKQWDSGYFKQQSTRPQTLGYALADSPIGQAAWIYEKFWSWTDCAGRPENVLSMDAMLDNIMLYWLTNTAASSARLYWESVQEAPAPTTLHVPTGCSIFPREIYRTPRSWAERDIHNLIHWNELEKGGHFAAFEQPQLFTQELRACFRQIR